MLLCKDKNTNKIVYTKSGRTDATGAYTIYVDEDHANQICDAKLVSSHLDSCKEATSGRDQARIILTRYNGIASDDRFANTMLFRSEEVASGCAEVLKQYQEFDNED